MKYKNLKEELTCRKIKKPNQFIAVIVQICLAIIARLNRAHYIYEYDRKAFKNKPVILLAAHVSRPEFIYVLDGFHRRDIHVVCGYQNMCQRFIYPIMIRLGVIAKYLYQPDLNSAKQMLRVVRDGRGLVLFPEGIQSTSGSNHPINPATVDLLRVCKLPVIVCTSEGTYLSKNRYSTNKKKGKITLRYQMLFTEEEVKTLSKEELYSRLLDKMQYNEFEANRRNRVKFVGKTPNIEGLDRIIYRCPSCQSEFKLKVEGEQMSCAACGFTVGMNEYYDLLPIKGDLPFQDIDQWFKWQRRVLHKEVQNPDFSMDMEATLYTICDKTLKWKRNNHVFICDGHVHMDQNVLEVTDQNGEVKLHCDMKAIYSLTFSLDGELEFYYHNEYYTLAPHGDMKQQVKWTIASEEIHNLGDPEWAKVSEDAYHYDA